MARPKTGWVALLRAVNVGGTGKLPMATLKAVGERAGFANVRTYIASGNLVFASDAAEDPIRFQLAGLLAAECGRPLDFVVRSAAAMAEVRDRNPFADCPGNRVVAIFSDEALSLDGVRHQASERLALGRGAIYIHYPAGMADSKLVIPAARRGTARNMNTVAKLAELAREAAA